jgi:hypothetical protein
MLVKYLGKISIGALFFPTIAWFSHVGATPKPCNKAIRTTLVLNFTHPALVNYFIANTLL